ncbi:DNA-processing protein DprA [Halioxenophilus aromaticivorans]|uniref:DNA-processing protein DprA n=1 Tax=Halioxenophilus aromaticivorans TaxID=1306992 RepID=A0AAV3U8Z4_9ALTE
MTTPHTSQQRAALALQFSKAPSPAKLYHALRRHGSAEQLIQHPSELKPLIASSHWPALAEFIDRGESSALAQRALATLNSVAELQGQLVVLGSDDYPQLLARAHDAPAILYVRGNVNALHIPAIALVGARHCTAQGSENAERFAAELAAGGFCIVSGLAAGIDGRAHLGALRGNGTTVAVMATGLDQVYPARHRKLAEDILANEGALITELPLGSKPLRAHFPQRNRIISGLSLGVLVVEAKVKSGSLITARTAANQDREVFAIPGSIHNPVVKGCHQLIKNGAKLVECTDDIMEELGGMLALKQRELDLNQANPNNPPDCSEEQAQILQALAHDAKNLDQLAASTGLNIDQLMIEVLNLELAGVVAQTDGQIERIF